VYNHFRSKAEILVTALERGSACLSMQVADTLAAASGPGSALRGLSASYAEFAVGHSALIGGRGGKAGARLMSGRNCRRAFRC
jgi:AcrR family transcriptional regulator